MIDEKVREDLKDELETLYDRQDNFKMQFELLLGMAYRKGFDAGLDKAGEVNAEATNKKTFA